jgi:hypothetical protein
MIQRIQSIYLFFTSLLSILFLKGSIISFIDESDNLLILSFRGLIKVATETGAEKIDQTLPLTGLLLLIPVLAFILIFFYKARKLQLRLTMVLFNLVIILILALAYYSFSIIRSFNAEIQPGINLVIPVLMLLCAFMAYRSIRKDDDLVKSYDRLR